eukprot:10131831-Alexandrium_andersonii.AAC.1
MSPRGPPVGIREPNTDGAAAPVANWGMYSGNTWRPGGEAWGFPPKTKGLVGEKKGRCVWVPKSSATAGWADGTVRVPGRWTAVWTAP